MASDRLPTKWGSVVAIVAKTTILANWPLHGRIPTEFASAFGSNSAVAVVRTSGEKIVRRKPCDESARRLISMPVAGCNNGAMPTPPSQSTIRNILREHGLEPAPKRGENTCDEFL
jgi:hypothetical protein